jgi:hypothetical protein
VTPRACSFFNEKRCSLGRFRFDRLPIANVPWDKRAPRMHPLAGCRDALLFAPWEYYLFINTISKPTVIENKLGCRTDFSQVVMHLNSWRIFFIMPVTVICAYMRRRTSAGVP